MDPADIEDLFEELEDMSDSAPEVDTMSISSTPKPVSYTHLDVYKRQQYL